jgi:hypothetical protein
MVCFRKGHLCNNRRTMCFVAAYEPDGRRTLSVQADITGSTLRLIPDSPIGLGALGANKRSKEHAHMPFSYCRSSCRSYSGATPETVPVNSPVSVSSTTRPAALNNTGVKIAVNVTRPDAPLKRPVPPVT